MDIQPPPKRRTQAERSEETRMRLCEATLDALNELGYEKMSTQDVARRANVSRGALTHQFPSRNDLIIAAFRYLIDTWEQGWPFTPADDLPRLEIEDLVDALWDKLFHTGRYIASLEMMLAARMDDDLGVGLRQEMSRWTTLRDRVLAEMLGLPAEDAHTKDFIQINLCLMRGIAVHRSFDTEPGQDQRLLAEWKRILAAARAAGLLPRSP